MGGGLSLFDAIEKQLGLKLELQKRTYPHFKTIVSRPI